MEWRRSAEVASDSTVSSGNDRSGSCAGGSKIVRAPRGAFREARRPRRIQVARAANSRTGLLRARRARAILPRRGPRGEPGFAARSIGAAGQRRPARSLRIARLRGPPAIRHFRALRARRWRTVHPGRVAIRRPVPCGANYRTGEQKEEVIFRDKWHRLQSVGSTTQARSNLTG